MCTRTYQGEEGPHVTAKYLDLGLEGDPGREELMAIEDLAVGVEGDRHCYTRGE